MKKKQLIIIILLAVSAVFLILLYSTAVDFRRLFASESPQPVRPIYHPRPTFQPTIADTESIKGWMTFGFINKVYNLPPSYLKDKLQIADKKYPAVSLEKAAELQKMPIGVFLPRVKAAIGEYLAANGQLR